MDDDNTMQLLIEHIAEMKVWENDLPLKFYIEESLITTGFITFQPPHEITCFSLLDNMLGAQKTCRPTIARLKALLAIHIYNFWR